MRRRLVATLVLGVALALPAAAAGKGPESASLSGPGLDRALPVGGDGEMGPGTPLGALVNFGGFFAQMYGQTPDPLVKVRPSGNLGPGYRVTYLVPGPNGVRSRVVQDVYTYAEPRPVTYMQPGQRFWGTERTLGGWFRAPATLRRTLVQAGLPMRPPQAAGFPTRSALAAGAGALVLLGLAVPLARPLRARRRSID